MFAEDKSIFALYTEIKDGYQKSQENTFWEKPPHHSAFILGVKKFPKITLFRPFSKIRYMGFFN